MYKDYVKETLKTISFYHESNITQTFGRDEEPIVTVCCADNSPRLQATLHKTQEILYFEEVEEAAAIINRLLEEQAQF